MAAKGIQDMQSANFAALFRKYLSKWLVLILAYLCLEGVFAVVLGSSAIGVFINFLEIQHSRGMLSTARAQWEAKGITHYQITVGNHNFRVGDLYACSQIKDVLTIRDGKVVNTAALPLADCQPVYDQLTVEKMLNRVAQELTTVNPFRTKMRVRFDPEFGFVSYYSVRSYTPFFDSVSEHPIVLTFSGFTVLDE